MVGHQMIGDRSAQSGIASRPVAAWDAPFVPESPVPRLVAVDLDGTFLRTDYTYDSQRFERLLEYMEHVGCCFAAATGNTYLQVQEIFGELFHRIACVADNGAQVMDGDEAVFVVDIPTEVYRSALEVFRADESIQIAVCALGATYCERGRESDAFLERTRACSPRLELVDDLARIDDRVLKFSLTVPGEGTEEAMRSLSKKLVGQFEVTTSGYGAIDVIYPGCHKAAGIERLARRRGIPLSACVAFGDGGNDIEMLRLCGMSYAMANAPERVRRAAKAVCPSNDEDGVLQVLDRLFPR